MILTLRVERSNEINDDLFEFSIRCLADDIFLGNGSGEILVGCPEIQLSIDENVSQ